MEISDQSTLTSGESSDPSVDVCRAAAAELFIIFVFIATGNLHVTRILMFLHAELEISTSICHKDIKIMPKKTTKKAIGKTLGALRVHWIVLVHSLF